MEEKDTFKKILCNLALCKRLFTLSFTERTQKSEVGRPMLWTRQDLGSKPSINRPTENPAEHGTEWHRSAWLAVGT
jgi:hypothetical protein